MEPTAQPGVTVLVVEDGQSLGDQLTAGLPEGRDGVRVLRARRGEEARYLSYARQPDVVVLDWRLADGSSPDLCQELSATLQRIPIVAVGGHPAREFLDDATARGAFEALPGPVHQDSLLATVRAALAVKARRTHQLCTRRRTNDDFNRLLARALSGDEAANRAVPSDVTAHPPWILHDHGETPA
jgi:DNA-binding NtrC family response regulator